MCQQVKLKLLLGTLFVYKAGYKFYVINGFDIVLGKRWMSDINCQQQINHDGNEMWISDNIWKEQQKD